jgi:hypothetical protein
LVAKHVNRYERLAACLIVPWAVTDKGSVTMAFDPARVSELIDQLANKLQTLLLLASRLEPD